MGRRYNSINALMLLGQFRHMIAPYPKDRDITLDAHIQTLRVPAGRNASCNFRLHDIPQLWDNL